MNGLRSASCHRAGDAGHVGARPARTARHGARLLLLGALAAGVSAAWGWRAGDVQAQLPTCRQMPYYHLGCDDGSGPDRGKWAWNPGEPANWPGLGVAGNVHWWLQYGWYDRSRYEAVRARDGDMPSLAVAFFDPYGECGCDVDVLNVRVRHHLNPPRPNQLLFEVGPGPCGGADRSVLSAYFVSTSGIRRGVDYDLSVDAQAHRGRLGGGQANLLWEADGTGAPSGECAIDPRGRVWLGGLKHCVDLRLKSTDPPGICCSTSHTSPLCGWQPCGG